MDLGLCSYSILPGEVLWFTVDYFITLGSADSSLHGCSHTALASCGCFSLVISDVSLMHGKMRYVRKVKYVDISAAVAQPRLPLITTLWDRWIAFS